MPHAHAFVLQIVWIECVGIALFPAHGFLGLRYLFIAVGKMGYFVTKGNCDLI